MRILGLAWRNFTYQPLRVLLSVALLSIMIVLLFVSQRLQKHFNEQLDKNSGQISVVVGAKSSPYQLMMATIYHNDYPTANISLKSVSKFLKNKRLVKAAAPIALGDSYGNYRIVGTTIAYPNFYNMKLAEGRKWKDKMEVCIGAEVAQKMKLKVGSTFHGAHNYGQSDEHNHVDFKVVGIYEPSGTVLDRLILCSLTTVWKVHAKEGEQTKDKEVTAVLIQGRNAMASLQLPNTINKQSNLMAIVPSFERKRLYDMIGGGQTIVYIMMAILMTLSISSIAVSFYQSIQNRKQELALLHSLGAGKFKLMSLLIIEGQCMVFISTILSLLGTQLAIYILNGFMGEQFQYPLPHVFLTIFDILAYLSIASVICLISVVFSYSFTKKQMYTFLNEA